jgi:VWFA-related protein
MHTRSLTSSLIGLALVMSASAQQPPPSTSIPPQSKPAATQQKADTDESQDVVRINTNLVQVDAVVLRDGKQVTDLKAEDFELFEDGRPQPITSFSYISNVPIAPANAPASRPGDKNGVPVVPPVVPATVRPHDVRRTLALVVDDLGMSFESMAHARKQLRKFIDEQLQPNDLVAIIRTGGEVGSLQQFTTDRRLLTSALDHLKWNPCSRAGISIFPPVGSPVFASGVDSDSGPCGVQRTNSTLRILQFVLKGMHDLPGRKSMVVFSESLPIQQQEPGPLNFGTDRDDVGDDDSGFGNTYSNAAALQKVAELAIRGSVVIYAVDTRGLQYTGPTAADDFSSAATPGAAARQMQTIMRTRSAMLLRGREGADLISRQTGGFLVRNSNDFELKRVMDDQRGYYLLGYRPGDETFNRRFHHLKVRVKRRGLTVRTREGFYGVSEDEARPPELTARDQVNNALISPFGANEIPVRLSTFFANDAAKGSLLRTFIYLDAHDLNFTDQPDGTHNAAFDLDTILFGDNGSVVNREDKTVTLRLAKLTYDRVQRDGLVYGFDMPVKQTGTFQFRVAVRDTVSSHIGAAGQFVEVPKVGSDRLALSGIFVRGALKTLNRPLTEPATEGTSPSGSRSPATDSTGQTKAVEEMTSGPGLRQFRQGTKLVFVYAIYNAMLDTTTHLPKLTTQTTVFREGKPIFTGNTEPLGITGQRDLLRLTNGAELLLGPELTPGEYVLQIIVEDQLAKEKRRSATQWIDFEVVK